MGENAGLAALELRTRRAVKLQSLDRSSRRHRRPGDGLGYASSDAATAVRSLEDGRYRFLDSAGKARSRRGSLPLIGARKFRADRSAGLHGPSTAIFLRRRTRAGLNRG